MTDNTLNYMLQRSLLHYVNLQVSTKGVTAFNRETTSKSNQELCIIKPIFASASGNTPSIDKELQLLIPEHKTLPSWPFNNSHRAFPSKFKCIIIWWKEPNLCPIHTQQRNCIEESESLILRRASLTKHNKLYVPTNTMPTLDCMCSYYRTQCIFIYKLG